MSENYIPLYRKYRPQTLEQLVGQEHVKKTLTSAIELGKIAHAFLFTGPRGTGKTSTARILAKSLNCKNGPTIHPCGECESCKDITNSIPIDVIEIDAASNRKVEDTQNILEKIQYVPVNGKYKIYIIDEVHMLTNHAFNALLKTLEEPPENVIFILATTEVHKVLDTIKSRCQRFDFRRITTDDIVKHLRYISDKENIKITDDALFAIAKNSAGGMRDSISLLDQLSLLGVTKEISTEDVNSILGRISFDVLYELSSKIINSNPNEAIEILNKIYNSGNEPLQILTNLSEYFKNLLIVKNCKKELLTELTGLNEAQIEQLSKQKELLETQQIVFLMERISYYIKEIKLSTNQHLLLEVGIIDLSNMTENTTLLDLQNRVRALESGNVSSISVHQVPQVVTRPAPVMPSIQAAEKTIEENITNDIEIKKEDDKLEKADDLTPPPMSKKVDTNDVSHLWQTLLSQISSPSTKALLRLATPVVIAPGEVVLTFKNEKLVSQISDTNKKQQIADAANVIFNKTKTTVIIRLPQAEDEKLINISSSVQEEKKKNNPIVEKEESEKEPRKQIDVAEKEIITPSEKASDSPKIETDQEKMILDLFDGKYIE